MKLLILILLPLLAISSCNSSNDESGSDLLADPVFPDPATAVITMDNHVEIVANIIAIFSGRLYGDAVFAMPDYSDPAYDLWPVVDPDTAALITQPADIVCSNGGTAAVVPETQGFFIDNLLTWNFDFDRCQDGIALLDGQLSRGIYEALHFTSSGFVRDEQTRVVRFSGSLVGRSGDGHYWTSTDMDFALESTDSSLVIEDSTTVFVPSVLSGEFKVRADWTGGQEITVSIPGDLEPGNDVGNLELNAGPDNMLVLDANTGDNDTVSVTLRADGMTTTFAQPWALWSDSLSFTSVSGY